MNGKVTIISGLGHVPGFMKIIEVDVSCAAKDSRLQKEDLSCFCLENKFKVTRCGKSKFQLTKSH